MINCQFCQKELKDNFSPPDISTQYSTYDCKPCQASFIYHGLSGLICHILYHQNYRHTFFLGTPTIYTLMKNGELLLTLNYFPDINPDNIQTWTEKLLKLKAFT